MSHGQTESSVVLIQLITSSLVTDLNSRLTSQFSIPLLARAVSSWSASSETHLSLHSSAVDVITALLSFSQGDVISVLQQRDDWWLGQLNGTQGWFPKSYVTVEAGGNVEYEDVQ